MLNLKTHGQSNSAHELMALLKPEVSVQGTHNQRQVVIIVADCRVALVAMLMFLREFFATIITSPPFFGLRNNGCGDRQIGLGRFSFYKAAFLEVFASLSFLLSPKGIIWWQIGEKIAGGGNGPAGKNAKINKDCPSRNVEKQFELIPPGYAAKEPLDLQRISIDAAHDAGLIFLDRIIWNKGRAQSRATRLDAQYEYILQFAKSPKASINKRALPDFFSKYSTNIWQIPPNSNDTASRYGVSHTSTFPPALPGICAALSAKKGDWVLDPFGGLGNTAFGVLPLGVNTILIEQDLEYAFVAAHRLLSLPIGDRPEVSVIIHHSN
jgi:DNA modification methylase